MLTGTCTSYIAHHFAIVVPLIFIGIWMFAVTLLDVLSGWRSLVTAYPDRHDQALQRFNWQSGRFGIIRVNSILKIGLCAGGVRFGKMWMFAPFGGNFFVPWDELEAESTRVWFWAAVRLRCAKVAVAPVIYGPGARQVLRAAEQRRAAGTTPAPDGFPVESRQEILHSVLLRWVLLSAPVALFFLVVPRLAHPHIWNSPGGFPLLIAALYFPVVFAVAALVSYSGRVRNLRQPEVHEPGTE